jgi:hypothetical protein
MPLVWELRCPRRVRSRRTLFQKGVESLRRDAQVRQVLRTQTSERLSARVVFWGDRGPADHNLDWLQGEFSVEQETPSQNHDPNPDLDMGCAYRPPTRRSLFALDLETSIVTMGRRSAGSFIHQQMAAYLVRMAHSAQGSLQQLARTLAAPLRRRLDNASLARRIFDIDPLPPVAPGTIYAVSDPEFVGRMPVRTELTVLTADEVARPPLRGQPHVFQHEDFHREPMPFLPLSRIFFQEYSYGAPQESSPLLPPLPTWCMPRSWAYNGATGRYALIEATFDRLRANVRYWRKGRLSRKLTLVTSVEFHHHWFHCDRPKMPRTSWWEDLLADEF